MADVPDPLKPTVPIEGGAVSTEGHDAHSPPDGVIDHDVGSADDLDPFESFSEWADEIDDANFADR